MFHLLLCDLNWSASLHCVMAVVDFLWLYQGQNEELFDSAACVRFLMGLLGSSLARPASKALSTVGSKLAGLGFKLKSASVGSGVDKAGAAVVAEVHQLFAKDEKSPFGHLNKDATSGFLLGQEVSSKWLALLTVEKACISPVVLDGNLYLNYRYSTHSELMVSWAAVVLSHVRQILSYLGSSCDLVFYLPQLIANPFL